MGFISLFLLRSLAWAYSCMPRSFQLYLGAGLGFLLRKLRIRTAVVAQNLLLAYPGAHNEMLRKNLFLESYRHLGRLSFEIAMLLGPMPSFIRRHTVVRGIEFFEFAKKQGKGVIILSSHTGNWEIMGAAGAYWAGIDSMIVTKHLKPEWLHRAIEKGRLAAGVAATYEPKTMRDILSQLKRKSTVGFVLDQYAGPPIGVRVPFLGVQVSTSTALAMLVKRTGAILLPAINYRDPEGRFIIEIKPPIPWQTHDDANFELASNTAAYVAELEKDVRRFPGQWLWIHRRFKGDLSPARENEWFEGRPRTDRRIESKA